MVYGGLLVLTGYMFQKVPTGFIPETDQGFMFVNVELPEGASLERTEQVMNQVERFLKSTPGVAHTINRIGSSIITQATASNSGTVICIFEPLRNGKRIGEVASRHPGGDPAEVCADSRGAGPGFSASAGARRNRGSEAYGAGSRRRHSRRAEKAAGTDREGVSRPELARVFTLFRANTPQILADINRIRRRARAWT